MAIGRLITQTLDEPDPGVDRAGRAPSDVLLWLERLLLVCGVAALGYFGYVNVETRLYQAMENRELDAILTSGPASMPARPAMPVTPGSAIGRIEIPRLGISSVIRAGVDARTLRLAVGHIPGTALPGGGGGNIGLAGHRDTFFRKLKDVRTFDEVRIVTPSGTYTYEVERTRIVKPQDTWVLDHTEIPSITLVTCYPFTYMGSAPERFIVRAIAPPKAGRGSREGGSIILDFSPQL